MDRFVLTQDLLTGVPDIDEQHRALLQLANRVAEPAALDQGEEVFREALGFLLGYVEYHFAAEEHVMKNAGYPGFDHHRVWHERFRVQISDLARAAPETGIRQTVKLRISFAVETWLLEHIRITDRTLADYLRRDQNRDFVNLPAVRALKAAGALRSDFDERFGKVV